jgi:NAD(P)-dependent dehydrogenase (short-subunit alcohol dehydrogenase family)
MSEGGQTFTGRVYLITGAAQGIGRELIKQLVTEGASVFFTYYKDGDHAQSLLDELRDHSGRIACREQDARMSDRSGAKSTVGEVLERFGRLDGLVNNAGYKLDRSFVLMNDDEWHDQIGINLNSVYYYTRAAIHQMVRQSYGRIVNMGAVSGQLIAGVYQVAYGASKGGLLGFTRSLAWELGPRGITANLVTTGMAETSGIRFPPDIRKVWAENVPLRRLATPQEVAAMVKYVLSPSGDYITGANLVIDGGMSLLGFTNFELLLPSHYKGTAKAKRMRSMSGEGGDDDAS